MHPRSLVKASTCVNRKTYSCKLEVLASPPMIVGYLEYSLLLDTFSFLLSCIDSVPFLFGFAGDRLFTMNILENGWYRKACRYLREILTYRDQRSRCVNMDFKIIWHSCSPRGAEVPFKTYVQVG